MVEIMLQPKTGEKYMRFANKNSLEPNQSLK